VRLPGREMERCPEIFEREVACPRGRVAVVLNVIRGSTVVEVENLEIRPAPADQCKHGWRLYIMDLNWPDFVEFDDVVYFLGIEDGFGRSYRVFRIIDRTGNRIRLETGREF